MNHVFWITGLSCSGKTSIGKMLYEHLLANNHFTVFLDGDELRKVFGDDLGYSLSDREKSAMRNARLCSLLGSQDINVICCTISLFHSVQEWNRKYISNYIEIYVKSPINVMRQRDRKGIYCDTSKDIAGVSVAIEEPEHPDLILLNDINTSISDLVLEIENYIAKEGVQFETR